MRMGHMTDAKRPTSGNAISRDRCGTEEAERKHGQGPCGRADEDAAAIEDAEEKRSGEAAAGHQSPEPGDGTRADGVRIVTVVVA